MYLRGAISERVVVAYDLCGVKQDGFPGYRGYFICSLGNTVQRRRSPGLLTTLTTQHTVGFVVWVIDAPINEVVLPLSFYYSIPTITLEIIKLLPKDPDKSGNQHIQRERVRTLLEISLSILFSQQVQKFLIWTEDELKYGENNGGIVRRMNYRHRSCSS